MSRPLVERGTGERDPPLSFSFAIFFPKKNREPVHRLSIKSHSPLKTSMKYGSTPEEYVPIPEKFREMSIFSCRVQHVPFLVVILTVEGNVNF